MIQFEEALKRIIKAIDAGIKTSKKDWIIIFESLQSTSDAKTILNVQDFI